MGEGAPAAVSFMPCAPALAPLITAYYLTEIRADLAVDLLHPEWGNLRFLFDSSAPWRAADAGGALIKAPRAAIFGATSRARVLAASRGRCLGVGLTPLGWATLIGSDASASADAILPAEALLGEAASGLFDAIVAAADDAARARLLDAFLLPRAAAAAPPRAEVARLTHLLADPAIASVQALAEAAELTPVTLARTCTRHFGFTPKLLLRRQRFLRTLATVLETGGRLIASLDSHYVDQPHFNREFRFFMGETPKAYFDRAHPILDAAARARRAALGASVQGLHVAGGGPK